jgi:hypothetical protein
MRLARDDSEGAVRAITAAVRARRAVCALGAAAWLLCLVATPHAGAADAAPAPPPAAATQGELVPEPLAIGEAPLLTLGPLEYRPGRGLRVGSTGFVIGGFTDIKAETTTDSGGEFSLDLLNFFIIFDGLPRFRAVAELQLKDIFVADEQHAGTQDFAFDVRRLFGDYSIADELHVRAGTFLTPIGYWNLILAPPLTWTTETPIIIEETFFQQTTTGVMLHGTTGIGDGLFGYSVFSQFLQPLADDPDLDPPDYTAGLRLAYDPAPGWSLGSSFQAAEADGEWSYLGGPFLFWQPRYGEVLSELYAQGGDALSSNQWGMYLQGVVEVYRPFYLVGRYEYYAPPSPDDPFNLFTFGAVWKPFPFMAVKVEYRFVDRTVEAENIDNLQGFFASFATFF